MSKFKLEVKNRETVIEKTEHYQAEIDGYDVIFTHDKDRAELSVAPIYYDGLRLRLLRFYPKSVAEIELLAQKAGDLFASIARELRALGKDDLRGEMEKMLDDHRERLQRKLRTPGSSNAAR